MIFQFRIRTLRSGSGTSISAGVSSIHEDLSRRLTGDCRRCGNPAAYRRCEQGNRTGHLHHRARSLCWLSTRPTNSPFTLSGSVSSIPGAALREPTSEEHLRSIELEIQTFHILPKGVFVAVLPSFVFNLNQDFNLFSLGVGAGRALNRRFLIQGAYVQHISPGGKPSTGLYKSGSRYLWGEDKAKP